MQHSRKAGGTTLCMTLRLNKNGLIKDKSSHWTMPRRETCQLKKFCAECDITRNKLFVGWDSVPYLMNCVMGEHNRNFIEIEGSVSPPNLLTSPEWSNFVFVSSLRHPIARIISLLHNTPPWTSVQCVKPNETKELNFCAHNSIDSTDKIFHSCQQGIFRCLSNYYVRMFAGHSTSEGPVTERTVEIAKNNFRRYSCVILQEQWGETQRCLSTKLGLHLSSNTGFNVNGEKPVERKVHMQDLVHSPEDFSETLLPEELKRLTVANKFDLEFYEWAKEVILATV